MSSTMKYSVEEVLNLTVADIQDPGFINVVKIEGWENLTSEVRERCMLKLRELMHQRDGAAQSSAVDADALTEKLNRIERPRSVSPSDSFVTPPPNPEEELEEDRRRENESYEALIKDNGRPCYPIELGFDVFDSPGQYRDILEYWRKGTMNKRLIFSAQWWEWKEFRAQQQRDRKRYVRRDWFPKFQESLRERRRKYGLDGDLHVCEKVADQSQLEDWMEYHDYNLREYEALVEGLEKTQEKLASRRKKLAEEGYSAFEEIENIQFGKYYGMTLDWSSREGKAKRKQKLAERKLKVAETRSEAAQSEELGEMVERDRWIGWFEKEVISRRTKKDELKPLVDKAKRDLEPYEPWFRARVREFDAKYGEYFRDSEEGRRLFEVEIHTAEYYSRRRKHKELQSRAHQARMAHFCAGEEVEFAEEVLEAARTEDLAPAVERAALIRRTQKEVRFAEFQVEEEKESTRVLDLKTDVIDALGSITSLKEGMKKLNILLKWIEQQRQELVKDGVDARRKSGLRQSTRVSLRVHTSPHVTRASTVDHPAKIRTRQQKTTTRSILDPVDPAKVSRTPRRSRKGSQRTGALQDISQVGEKTNVDLNIPEPKNDKAAPVKDGTRARFHPVHSSRVSKPASKRPIARRKDTTRLSPLRDRRQRTGKEPVDGSTLITGAVDESMYTSMQRSTRESKRLRSRPLGSK